MELAGELARPGDEHGRTPVSHFTCLNNIVDIVEAQPLDVEAGLAELLGELAHLKNSSKVSNPEAGKQIFKPVNSR